MKRWARALLIITGVVLVLSVSIHFIMPQALAPVNAFRLRPTRTPWPTINRAARTTPRPSPSEEITPAPSPTPGGVPLEEAFDDGRGINILLLGYDMSAERERAGLNARTDAMLLVRIDFEARKVTLISIPRDSRVRIEGGGQIGKINAAFSYAGGAAGRGFEAAVKTVEWVMGGIPVHYYVGVDMNAAKDLVDALGGVDYDVDIALTMDGRRLEKGFQHLDGQQALDYCRFRRTGRGDLDRVERQQRLLEAIFEQNLRAGTLFKIPAIYESLEDRVQTTLSARQIASLCWFAKDLSPGDISGMTLPGYATYIDDLSYFVLDRNGIQEIALEVFGVEITAGKTD